LFHYFGVGEENQGCRYVEVIKKTGKKGQQKIIKKKNRYPRHIAMGKWPWEKRRKAKD